MANIYTNCNSCVFLNKQGCSLGKWNTNGFSGLVDSVNLEDGILEHRILGRICTFHRTNNWAEHHTNLGVDIHQQVADENILKYGLMTCIDDESDPEAMLLQMENVVNSKHVPQKLYIINNCSDPKYTNEYLKNKLQKYNLPYKIKKALAKQTNAKFIDEFAMTDRLTEYFYLGLLKPGFDLKFLDNLHDIIYGEMIQAIYAGDEDSYYFMPTNLHKMCSCGFRKFLDQESSGTAITYSYQDVLKK